MSELSILAPLDTADLLGRGLLGYCARPGAQRLHKRRLSPSSNVEYFNLSLNVPLSSAEAIDAFAVIPVAIVSYETLIYVGLSEAKATELWSQWINSPTQGPRGETDPDDSELRVAFKEFIIGSFAGQIDATGENAQQWRACLNACGVAADVQEAIMDPLFEDLCFSQSCLYWVNDTVKMRYAGLEDIQRWSRERDMRLQRLATRSDGNHGGNGHDGQQDGRNIATASYSSFSHVQSSILSSQ